ncbi:hypothetical protein DFH06DRAFT_1169367 [Mycena polygramma]|nr:hypothetical protein DFH06DRAFT_1169367 [Mycena polygramma]
MDLAGSAGITNTVRIEACGVLVNLVVSPTPTHSQRTELCRFLVSLLHGTDTEIAAAARRALSSTDKTLKAVEASLDLDTLDYPADILDSPTTYVRGGAWRQLINLISYNVSGDHSLSLCVWLASFLCVADDDVLEAAAHALSLIAGSLEGAEIHSN